MPRDRFNKLSPDSLTPGVTDRRDVLAPYFRHSWKHLDSRIPVSDNRHAPKRLSGKSSPKR